MTKTLALAGALLLAAAAAGCGGSGTSPTRSARRARELRFELTDAGCTPSNARVQAGAVRIVASNPASTKTDEIELKNADGIILGERENLAPGLSGDFTLDLRPGRYTLNCTFGNDERDNGTITVTGAAPAAKADDALLTAAVAGYKGYVARQTAQLVESTERFTAALQDGDVAQAKALFGPTRFHYEAVEPIAESFGDLDPSIDARVNDVADTAHWTGFHRIEQTLWRDDTTRGTATYAARLLADVRELDAKVGGLRLQPAQVANGAVALLDEVSSSKITGEEDRYSHTDLSDFAANVAGARAAFAALTPALRREGDGQLVATIDDRLSAVERGLDRYRRDTPLGYATYTALTPADRRQLAQQVTSLAEPLSLVAGKVLPS
ncbi:MAG: iron uptake system component EfeO [Solirubrobacteraceae bacterium]|nr:iron uptake system component EfeO [Solirubrobacteraceae bacterium]